MKTWIIRCAVVLCLAQNFANAGDEMSARILIETDAFTITERDLFMYLKPTEDEETSELDWGSRERVREGLQQLYALNVLRIDAEAANTLTAEEQRWIARHEVSMSLVRQYLADQVAREAEEIDFERLAREYYVANKHEFRTPERRTLRALLIRTDCRSPEEAVTIASELLSGVQTEEQFEAVIRERTEDAVAAQSGGLMPNVVRGDTVTEFEEAAFSLENPGDISDPVVSEFGAHVVQLLSILPPAQVEFAAVRDRLISKLDAEEQNKILATLRMEARERRPDGLVLNMEALEDLVLSAESVVGELN
jgi:hypothetical protein